MTSLTGNRFTSGPSGRNQSVRAIMSFSENGAPDLDSMNLKALSIFSRKYANPSIRDVLSLFPSTTADYHLLTSAAVALSSYASTKLAQSTARARGDTQSVRLYQEALEVMYRRLPSYAKW